MKQNVGPREQLFRIGIGFVALAGVAFLPQLRRWRWMLAAWGLANIASAVTRYCPSNQLTGIDNTRGDELVHFNESLRDFRGRVGRRLNRLQRRISATS
jgi:hypothetical protein